MKAFHVVAALVVCSSLPAFLLLTKGGSALGNEPAPLPLGFAQKAGIAPDELISKDRDAPRTALNFPATRHSAAVEPAHKPSCSEPHRLQDDAKSNAPTKQAVTAMRVLSKIAERNKVAIGDISSTRLPISGWHQIQTAYEEFASHNKVFRSRALSITDPIKDAKIARGDYELIEYPEHPTPEEKAALDRKWAELQRSTGPRQDVFQVSQGRKRMLVRVHETDHPGLPALWQDQERAGDLFLLQAQAVLARWSSQNR